MARNKKQIRVAYFTVSYAVSHKTTPFFRTSIVRLPQDENEALVAFEDMVCNNPGALCLRLKKAIEKELKEIEFNDTTVCIVNFWKYGERKYEDVEISEE